MRWDENFIELPSPEISIHKFYLVAIVTGSTPREYLNYLRQKEISYIEAGPGELEFDVAFKKVVQLFGIDRLVLEGGGNLNGSIVDEDMIDEISLLYISIVVNNKSAPALFNLAADEFKIQEFTISEVTKLDDDVLWIRFKREED